MRWVLVLLGVLQVLFWKLRILDRAAATEPWLGATDLYREHHPMAVYALERLSQGELPLWNPHQLFGLPFLAVPHTAVLYPPTWLFVWADAATATELSLVLHLSFAAVCMFGLTRALGGNGFGGFAAALGYVWSNQLFMLVPQHAWLTTTCWMPATLWLVERVVRRERLAAPLLAGAVAAQILAGSHEAVVHNLMAAGILGLFRLGPVVRSEGARAGMARAGALLGCVALGVVLAAPQLVPTFELVFQSARWLFPIHAGEAPSTLGHEVIGGRLLAGFVLTGSAVGILAVMAPPLALRLRGRGNAVAFCLVLAGVSALLMSGGELYELYRATPIGGLFRRPTKFMTHFVLAGSLLVGLAVTRLWEWRDLSRAELWRSPAWGIGLGCVAAVTVWLGRVGAQWSLAAALLGVMLLFGLAAASRVRVAAVVALVGIQAGQLFTATPLAPSRPFQRDASEEVGELLAELRERAGDSRVYASRRLSWGPLFAKQATVHGFDSPVGYQALALARQAQFFEQVTGPLKQRFSGHPALSTGARWDVLDLTGTRFFLLERGSRLETQLSRGGSAATGFRPVALSEVAAQQAAAMDVRVYERPSAWPRASFVPQALMAAAVGADAAMRRPGAGRDGLVVLSSDSGEPPAAGERGSRGVARVEAVSPERVDVEVWASGAGFLVLSDSWYPGWRAVADGRELPIYRANLVFRAVAVEPGYSRLRFEYRPRSLWLGSGLGLAGAVMWGWLLVRGVRRTHTFPFFSPLMR